LLCPREPCQNLPTFAQKGEEERVFAKKVFSLYYSFFDKEFSFVKRLYFSSHRCPEWWISLAKFARQ